MRIFLTRGLIGFALLALLCAVPATGAEDDDKYTDEELQEIVGPIALYPDVVLSSLLPASTFPTDVVEAARWLNEQDGEVDGAPEDSGWDESVDAMIQFPDVLIWMNDNLDWMEQLAWAVAVQQEDVLGAIQAFRAAAQKAGNLETDEHVQVIEGEDEVLEIQPVEPEIIYVPQYNPVYVTQPASAWPPTYRGNFWAGFAAGALGAWAINSIRWGGYHGGRWGGGGIAVNRSPTFNFNNNGVINRGNINRGTGGRQWNGKRPTNRAGGAPRSRGGVNKPRNPGWNNKRSKARPAKGGTKPGKRPSNRKPGGRPGTKPGSRPGKGPSKPPKAPGAGKRPGGGNKPSTRPGGGNKKPSSKPSNRGGSNRKKPSASKPSNNKSSFGGSNRGGSSARKSSSRGNSSMNRSRSSGSSRSRSSGSRGGSRGGGGGRGGGGRRR